MVARRRGLRSAALLAALVALGSARIGHADDPRGEARAHYAKGLELAGQNGYEGALREFNAAYAISPQFAVLFNIGQAHIALGHTAEAIEALTHYLSDGGDRISPTRRTQVERQIAGLRSTLPNPEVPSEAQAARATAVAAGAAADEAIEAASEGPRGNPDRPLPGARPQADARRQAGRSGCVDPRHRFVGRGSPPGSVRPRTAFRRGDARDRGGERGAGDLRESPGGRRPTRQRAVAADRRARVHGRHHQSRDAHDPREDRGLSPRRPRPGPRWDRHRRLFLEPVAVQRRPVRAVVSQVAPV